jgi:hypothetical protein
VQRVGARGFVALDTRIGWSSTVHIEWEQKNFSPEKGKSFSGSFRAESTDFDSEPRGGHYVPFQRKKGVSAGIIQHGCTNQGEPSFPLMKSEVSTWGHVNIFNNGTLVYENLWLHTMYTNRARDLDTNAIWADKAHTRSYSPKRCWEGDVDDDQKEFHFIAARWCHAAPNSPPQVHPTTDVNIVFSFTTITDVSGPPGSPL